MRRIETIDSIYLKKSQVLCKRAKGETTQLAHHRQGTLDGACGAYSIVTVLIINNILNKESFTNDKPDGRTSIGKLIKEITEKNGLYRNGLTLKQLKSIVDSHYSNFIETKTHKKPETVLEAIGQNIKENIPTIIGIEYNETEGHWLVAIGLSYNQKGNIEHILCIDPGSEPSKIAVWNEVIEVSNTNKFTHNNLSVQLTEGMTIKNLE